MSQGDLTYDRYVTNGNEEWLLRVGPADRPVLLFLPPLFEELNRTRAMIVRVMRALAERGWSCVLPDLPGTGESPRPLESIGWEDWRRAAIDAAPASLVATIALRGGGLLDDGLSSPCAWRLAPAAGAALLRDLERAGLADEAATGGYAPAESLRTGLQAAAPVERSRLRVVRLSSDRSAADHKIDAPPPWRRAEPQSSSKLASTLACDIDEWVRACAVS